MGWTEANWGPVEQHGGIAHGQEHSHPLVEVPGDLALFLPCLSSLGRGYLLHLLRGRTGALRCSASFEDFKFALK